MTVQYDEDICKNVLVLNADSRGIIDKIICEIYKQFRMRTEDRSISLTIGVGEAYENVNYISMSYNEAIKALSCMISEGKDTVIYYNTAFLKEQTGYYYPMNVDLDILDALKEGNSEKIGKILDNVIKKNIFEYDLNLYSGRCLFYQIFSSTIRNFNELKLNSRLSIDYDTVDSLTTLYDIYDYFLELYKKACTFVSQKAEQSCVVKDNDIVAYIDSNCYNMVLCLESVANQFNVSVSYISHIFKNTVGTDILIM